MAHFGINRSGATSNEEVTLKPSNFYYSKLIRDLPNDLQQAMARCLVNKVEQCSELKKALKEVKLIQEEEEKEKT